MAVLQAFYICDFDKGTDGENMTRGKIVYIDKGSIVHSSCEFNGDMYPEGRGDQILEKFHEGYFTDVDEYRKYVERFNRRNFGYDYIFENSWKSADGEWCVDDNYTDYLYIINGSEKDFILLSEGNKYAISVGGMAIVYFQKVEQILMPEQRGKGQCPMLTMDGSMKQAW